MTAADCISKSRSPREPKRHNAHGFRLTFYDWAGGKTHYPREFFDETLVHGIKDKAEATYARGDPLVKRGSLMEDRAVFLLSACTR